MTKSPQPSPARLETAQPEDHLETNAPESEADRRRGVLRQRQHIKDLTGEDPLRGGIAD